VMEVICQGVVILEGGTVESEAGVGDWSIACCVELADVCC
jgi:hypothetical protein